MKRTLLLILSLFLLTAQAEKIDSPLVHAEEYPSGFVVDEEIMALDISPVITFQTDETGVFAVVTLASSEELSTPAPALSTPAPFVTPDISEELETVEAEEAVEEPAAFIISTRSTSRSLIYTLAPVLPPEEGEQN